jgi:pyruvate dehydrogenase (quinone)
MLSIRYPMEINLVGDAAATLRALMPYLQRKADRSWRSDIETRVADWWEKVEKQAEIEADPIHAGKLFAEFSRRMPDDVIVTADSGSAAIWFARNLKMRLGMMASLSGTLATMCPGVPYATAAKFAFPERLAVAFVGDGAMQMLGINGLITIGYHWREWSDPRLIVAVLNNEDLNMVTWELRGLGGTPKVETTQDLPSFNYAAFAELAGLKGIRVETPEAVGPAWEAALSADRPTVIDCRVDPNVLPLPPHISASQAAKFGKAMLKGDPDAAAVIWQTVKNSLG